ncbi:MAG: EF-hand domain-containing protein, partial [Planctomycetaceae bacterium]|nr:EF-hand domain-containing protein [Planctomycetaceae bacterium]
NMLSAAPEKDGESTPQNIFQQLDKNSDGTVTADEVPEEKERFFDHLIRMGDQNKDGKLTKEEFEAGLKKEDQKFPAGDAPNGNRGPRNFDFKTFLSRLDRNGDKKISKEELPEPLRERMEPLFQRLNKDEISLDEFEKYGNAFRGGRPGGKPPENRTRKPGETGEGPERFFNMLDTNKDGKLTLDEAPERGKQFLRRLLEKTGKGENAELTKEEFRKELATFRPDRRPSGRENDKEEMKRPEMRPESENRPDRFPGRPPVPAFMQTLDSNKDGRLDKEELNQLKVLLEKLDRNEDGYLDLAEMMGMDRRPFEPRGRDRMDRPRRPERERPETERPQSDTDKKDKD